MLVEDPLRPTSAVATASALAFFLRALFDSVGGGVRVEVGMSAAIAEVMGNSSELGSNSFESAGCGD